MSKQVVSQKMEMKCDACGKTKVWELVGADQNIDTLREMQEWYSVIHKVIDYHDGQLRQLAGDACSVDCVAVLAVKLQLPSTDESGIDFDALRSGAGNVEAN
jgi:hypothetical protein